MVFYNYMIFWKMQDYVLYRFVDFWNMYPSEHRSIGKLGISLYITLYLINLYWFSHFLFGFLDSIGLMKAIQNTEKMRLQRMVSNSPVKAKQI